jgi:D-alanyl-lipoteichoic acid acyltransferase DltB (MBOAT superfamily)
MELEPKSLRPPRFHIPAPFSNLLIAGGLAVALLALGAELIGLGGKPGIGRTQRLVAAAAVAMAGAGVLLDLLRGGHQVRGWFADRFADARGLFRFLAICAQLGLLVLVMRRYEMESRAFYHNILLLAAFGFLFSHCLPQRWRLPFFLLLSLGGICGVLGPANAAWLAGAAVLLIGLCRLPLAFGVRVGLVLAVGAAFAAMRADWLQAPLPQAIWPILGSMFMFRLIVFLYDLKHQKDRPSLTQTLAYFFLLPNVVFPLFPVVDFQGFRRNYFDAPWAEIYQRGVHWMFRGLTHLLLYRLLNQFVMIAPEEVTSAADLLRYLAANFLLYLRVSGQFHIIAGMLCLFGFRLPETNNKYCLSSSFTDFWRRINIYWKDFMIKVFYYPAYFKLQRLGATPALLLSTGFVFLATWILHAYQWFWLRGSFLLSVPDVLFWTLLGLLMLANAWWEAKRGRKRTLGKAVQTPAQFVWRALRTGATFGAIVLLWSLWSSASLADWFSLFARGWAGAVSSASAPALDWRLLLALPVMALAGAAPAAGGQRIARFFRSPLWVCLVLGTLLVVAHPRGYSRLPSGAGSVVSAMRSPLSQREADLLQRGYYENLTSAGSFNTQLLELYSSRPERWEYLHETAAGRLTTDFHKTELVPSARILFNGQPFTTNRWALRDKDYQQLPPAGHYRIAVLGSSQTMGAGVSDGQSFESLLEERLNQELAGSGEPWAAYELLNFAMGGRTPPQYLYTLQNKIFSFQPHGVFYIAHPLWETQKTMTLLAECLRSGLEIPYPELRAILEQAGVGPQTTEEQAMLKLTPVVQDLLLWIYRRFVEECHQHGAVPVWIFLPISPGEEWGREQEAMLKGLAGNAGFVVISAPNVFAGHDASTLRVSEWDARHPNAKGHRIIADHLFQLLRNRPEALGRPPDGARPQAPVR